MTERSDTAIETWLRTARPTFIDFAKNFSVDYRKMIAEVIGRESIDDDVFAQVVNLLLRNLKQELSTFSAAVFFNKDVLKCWSQGESLPKPEHRRSILELCTKEAWQDAEDDPVRLLRSVVPEFFEGRKDTGDFCLVVPDYDLPLLEIPGWETLSVRCQHGLMNELFASFGELASCTEARLLRIHNFGRKSLIEIKKWLLTFDLHFPPSDRDVPEHLLKYAVKVTLRDKYTDPLPYPDNSTTQSWVEYGLPKEVYVTLYRHEVKTLGKLATLTAAELENMFEGDGPTILSVKQMLKRMGLQAHMG